MDGNRQAADSDGYLMDHVLKNLNPGSYPERAIRHDYPDTLQNTTSLGFNGSVAQASSL